MRIDKRDLSERDICTKFITPALRNAGWDVTTQIREEVSFTKGRTIVRGKMVSRGEEKRADYILSVKPNIPIALIEAKVNRQPIGSGIQQGLGYAETLNVPFVFSSNGDGFVFHDRTGQSDPVEQTLTLDEFPSPNDLWRRYCQWKGLTPDEAAILSHKLAPPGPAAICRIANHAPGADVLRYIRASCGREALRIGRLAEDRHLWLHQGRRHAR